MEKIKSSIKSRINTLKLQISVIKNIPAICKNIISDFEIDCHCEKLNNEVKLLEAVLKTLEPEAGKECTEKSVFDFGYKVSSINKNCFSHTIEFKTNYLNSQKCIDTIDEIIEYLQKLKK